MSILSHHSNLRLPVNVERQLVRCIVTPRMHGIHHSDYREETDSNWSSLPSWWDLDPRHHETSRRVSAIATGVPAYQQAEDVTLGRITALPFSEQREDWKTVDGVPQIRRPAAVRVPPLTGA